MPVEISARIVTLELAETFVISRESTDTAEVVQVELRDGEHVGYGEAAPITRYGQSAEPTLAFLEQHADEPIDETLARTDEPAARSALDSALHDLRARAAGQPAWRHLGLPRTGPP